jgi:hypothetical protein
MKLFSVARPDEDRLVGQDTLTHFAGCKGAVFRNRVWWLVNVALIVCGVRMLWKRAAITGIQKDRKSALRPEEQDIYFA